MKFKKALKLLKDGKSVRHEDWRESRYLKVKDGWIYDIVNGGKVIGDVVLWSIPIRTFESQNWMEHTGDSK